MGSFYFWWTQKDIQMACFIARNLTLSQYQKKPTGLLDWYNSKDVFAKKTTHYTLASWMSHLIK